MNLLNAYSFFFYIVPRFFFPYSLSTPSYFINIQIRTYFRFRFLPIARVKYSRKVLQCIDQICYVLSSYSTYTYVELISDVLVSFRKIFFSPLQCAASAMKCLRIVLYVSASLRLDFLSFPISVPRERTLVIFSRMYDFFCLCPSFSIQYVPFPDDNEY